MHHRTVFFLLVSFGILLTAGPSAIANDAGEGLGPSLDFKFMELRQQLREHPSGEEALHKLFAIGEYYFSQNMPQPAAESFIHLSYTDPKNNEEMLAAVYLLRCARLAHDEKNAAQLEKNLQESLSSRQFIATFCASREWDWRSPLGNRYHFCEAVDQLEIQLNGKPFYSIDLS